MALLDYKFRLSVGLVIVCFIASLVMEAPTWMTVTLFVALIPAIWMASSEFVDEMDAQMAAKKLASQAY